MKATTGGSDGGSDDDINADLVSTGISASNSTPWKQPKHKIKPNYQPRRDTLYPKCCCNQGNGSKQRSTNLTQTTAMAVEYSVADLAIHYYTQ